MSADFHPSQEVVKDFIVYEDFADFLIGKPVECERNRFVRQTLGYERVNFGTETTEEFLARWVSQHNRDNQLVFIGEVLASATFTGAACIPAFTIGAFHDTIVGAGLTGVVSAPLDPVHPAYQPPVPRWVGPRGHCPAPGALFGRRGEGPEPAPDALDATAAWQVGTCLAYVSSVASRSSP